MADGSRIVVKGNALVTGAGQGVGREIALELAAAGASVVVVNDYYRDRAEAVAEEIRAAGGKARAAAFDVSSAEGIGEAVKELAGHDISRFAVLVNNAGNAGPKAAGIGDIPFWQQTDQDWEKYLQTNLYGAMNCVRAVCKGMVDDRFGRVINIVSDAGRMGQANAEAYSAAKAGVAGFTRSFAASMGRYGVTANCISLAAMDTPGTPRIHEDAAAHERSKKILSRYVVRRYGLPSDVSGLAAFLASDRSSWITGQVIPVNGGYTFAL